MKKLGEFASIHIYFQLLYVRCYYRQTAMYIQNDRGSAEDRQMLEEPRQLPEQLPLYQKQIRRFFDLVLDVDSAGGSRGCRQCGIPRAPSSERAAACRDIGALKQWTIRQAGNNAFKAYRKEYKRRFA